MNYFLNKSVFVKYILDDNHNTIPASLTEWGKWFQTARKKRIVKQVTLLNGYYLSTVFLGLDHSFGRGKPLLFETMVFISKDNLDEQDRARYTTWKEAEKGHAEMVKKWKKRKKYGTAIR